MSEDSVKFAAEFDVSIVVGHQRLAFHISEAAPDDTLTTMRFDL